ISLVNGPALLINGIVNVGGNVTVTNTGSISLFTGASPNIINAGSGNVTLTSTAGSITEFGGDFITANLLTTNSATGTTLDSLNSVSSFNATNTTSGDVTLANGNNLTITGISNPVGN